MPHGLRVLLCFALLNALGSSAEAVTILARCGPSTGQSYYFEGGLVGPGQGGWRKDGFDNGRITAYINDKDQIDLLVQNQGNISSYLQQGYRVALINFSKQDRSFLISTNGPNFSESYLFTLNEIGVGTLVWTTSVLAPMVIRTSAMTAECGPKYEIKP